MINPNTQEFSEIIKKIKNWASENNNMDSIINAY